MKRIDTAIAGVCVIEPPMFADARGHFFECYRTDKFAALGITHTFVQDNQSHSRRGVLRGLHYQLGCPQAKLVRCLAGEIFDVALDVRRGSPTFGQWVGETLSAANRRMLFIPEGFAHGFYVTSETADVLYKCSDLWAPKEERGIVWNDPNVGISWPIAPASEVIVHPKDQAYTSLASMAVTDLPVYQA